MAVVQEENPLVEGLERLPVHPTTLVIFGGTGDLAHRKLLPAIYNLAHEGALPEGFNLIGVSRSDMSDDDYRAMAREAIEKHSRRPPDAQVLEKLLERVRYVPGTFDEDSVFERLSQELAEFDEEAGIAFNRIFYLSTAPTFFALIVKKLGEHGLHRNPEADVRVVIEKPFGTRLTEALESLDERVLLLDDGHFPTPRAAAAAPPGRPRPPRGRRTGCAARRSPSRRTRPGLARRSARTARR